MYIIVSVRYGTRARRRGVCFVYGSRRDACCKEIVFQLRVAYVRAASMRRMALSCRVMGWCLRTGRAHRPCLVRVCATAAVHVIDKETLIRTV